MGRAYVYTVSLVLVALALWPAFRRPWEDDSFPLSTFPMFSRERPRLMRITHALAVGEDGQGAPISPQITSGNMEVLQSMATIGRAVHGGPDRRRAFCREVAARIRTSDDPALASAAAVELVTSEFDVIDYFQEGPTPRRRWVHERCEVRP